VFERARARSLFGGSWLVLGGKLGRRLLCHDAWETVTDLDDDGCAFGQDFGFQARSIAET